MEVQKNGIGISFMQRVIKCVGLTYTAVRTAIAGGIILVVTGCQTVTTESTSLVGVWQFVKETNATQDGTPVTVPSLSYHGLLIYSANGYVSAIVMPDDRHWVGEAASVEEFRASTVEGSTSAYTGRYSVDARAHSVTHAITVSVEPLLEGQKLVRRYEVEGNSLMLSGDWIYMDTPLRWSVHWSRLQ